MIALGALACVPSGRAFLGGVFAATWFLVLFVAMTIGGVRMLADIGAEAEQITADERDDEPVHVTGEPVVTRQSAISPPLVQVQFEHSFDLRNPT